MIKIAILFAVLMACKPTDAELQQEIEHTNKAVLKSALLNQVDKLMFMARNGDAGTCLQRDVVLNLAAEVGDQQTYALVQDSLKEQCGR